MDDRQTRPVALLHAQLISDINQQSRRRHIPAKQQTWNNCDVRCSDEKVVIGWSRYFRRGERTQMEQYLFHQESGGGWRKDEARPLVAVFPSVLYYCQFGDWQEGHRKPLPLIPKVLKNTTNLRTVPYCVTWIVTL